MASIPARIRFLSKGITIFSARIILIRIKKDLPSDPFVLMASVYYSGWDKTCIIRLRMIFIRNRMITIRNETMHRGYRIKIIREDMNTNLSFPVVIRPGVKRDPIRMEMIWSGGMPIRPEINTGLFRIV
jgi:hypothetical protein